MPLPFETKSTVALPETIHGYISVRSQGGKSPLALKTMPRSVEGYRAKPTDFDNAVRAAESAGLNVIALSRLGLAVAGPAGAYEELTGGRLVTTERLHYAENGKQRYVTHIDVTGQGQPQACGCAKASSTSAFIEAILVERPRQYHGISPSPIPPSVDRYHLRVPDDISVGLSAEEAHRAGQFGNGIKVAMVDSGQYAHPFFAAHGYDVQPADAIVPGTNPGTDPHGHGTGESANIFAVAPGAQLLPYRASNNAGQLVGAIAGFLAAKAANPRVLTNSWGGDGPFPPLGPPDQFDIVWALEIQDAVDQGIFVVFSAGNSQFTIEPQVPGVLAAGGVFMENALDLRASNYTSGYKSPWFRKVIPDVSGLVGLLPRASYIMLPVPPGSPIDFRRSVADGSDPSDGTGPFDGWALFSGTSAAAPQIAGVAALVLGAKPNLRPSQVMQAIKSTATDVIAGRCHPRFNNSAQPGDDAATGKGLVDASAAVQFAVAKF